MPVPIDIQSMSGIPKITGSPFSADFLWQVALEGRLYVASGSAQNTTVTGQTSFSATTPTFLLDVPTGHVALPLWLNLSQTGSVAGGAVDVYIELHGAKRYASGGTVNAPANMGLRSGRPSHAAFYTNPTGLAGFGAVPWHATIGQDVSPAEGAVQGPFWRPEAPFFMPGPYTWQAYTWAGTTGPTWFYAFGWAEWTVDELKTAGLIGQG